MLKVRKGHTMKSDVGRIAADPASRP